MWPSPALQRRCSTTPRSGRCSWAVSGGVNSRRANSNGPDDAWTASPFEVSAIEGRWRGRHESGLIPTGTTALFTIIKSQGQVEWPRLNYFNRLFIEHGHDAVHVAFDPAPVRSGRSSTRIALHRYLRQLRGPCHISSEATQPHGRVDAPASAPGVVTVEVDADGRIVGDTTDGPPFVAPAPALTVWILPERAAMVGGGERATADAHACAEQGAAEVYVPSEIHAVTMSCGQGRRVGPNLLRSDSTRLTRGLRPRDQRHVGQAERRPNVPHPVESLDPERHGGRGGRRRACVVIGRRASSEGAAHRGTDMSSAQLDLVGPCGGGSMVPPRSDAQHVMDRVQPVS